MFRSANKWNLKDSFERPVFPTYCYVSYLENLNAKQVKYIVYFKNLYRLDVLFNTFKKQSTSR